MSGASSEQRPMRDVPEDGIEPGTALCLSGGGFRAMVFHVGGIRRLHELGLLDDVAAISSVSGGSITSAAMAMHWTDRGLDLDAFEREVFGLADRTIDVPAILGAPFRLTSVSSNLARLYDRHLLDGRSLLDVPDAPLFVYNTTNMHTGNAFQWTKFGAHDYALGRIETPDVALSSIVAASSAFPPVLSPSKLTPPGDIVDPATGVTAEPPPGGKLWLTDGGVYDNLGLQPVDHLATLFVSDAGAPFKPTAKLRANWGSVTMRTLSLLQDQVGKRRRYEELYAPGAAARQRFIWSLRAGHPATGDTDPDGLAVSPRQLAELAAVHTRLAKIPPDVRHRLANLSYALADRLVRPTMRPHEPAPTAFPYPGGLGPS